MKFLKYGPLPALLLLVGVIQAKDYNILNYGAHMDSTSLSTAGIQKAIDQCSKDGGGTVLVPPGVFLSSMIRLKSNVNLHLAAGAKLKALANGTAYESLVSVNGAENVRITGQGTLFGNGTNFVVREAAPGRPRIISVRNSKNILIEDVTLSSGATWALALSGNDQVVIRNITVYSHGNYNNDGIDIDSKNVLVTGCNIDCSDDALCLKSDDPEKICENVTITNCVAASNCNLIKMGTSSVSGFRNINISNCTLKRASESPVHSWHKNPSHFIDEPITGISGIALEVVDGGLMDNVNISDITITGVQTPIFLRLGSRRTPTGSMKNIRISNIKATSHSRIASIISGVPGHNIENVVLRNIVIDCKGGGTATDAARIMPEKEAEYPENRMFGWATPAYGLYIRHAKNISLQNVRFNLKSSDQRPAVWLDDTDSTTLKNVQADKPASGVSWLRQVNTRNVSLFSPVVTKETPPRDPLSPYIHSKPANTVLLGTTADSVAVKRFSFASRKGANTIYGTIVSPRQTGIHPALLLLHGGGSCADGLIRLQRFFASKGYVVMAIDLPGICDPAKAPLSSGAWRNRPKGTDSRLDISKGVDSSTLVDAVAAALEGFNLLAAEQSVDKNAIAISGFSWGGYMTTMLSGLLGKRVKAAYAVFGCGFYDRGSHWKEQLEKMPDNARESWSTYFDAGRRAPGIQCPYFIEAAVNDRFFWPEAVAATLDAIKTEKNLLWSPNLDHVRPAGAEQMQLLYFNYHLKATGKPFGKVAIKETKPGAANSKDLLISVKMPQGITADSIVLYYAEKNAPRHTRTWSPITISKIDDENYRANIPYKVLSLGVDYFVYVRDSRKVCVSTYIQI